ncbi:hypothetical protein M422DRAFT_239548 [Sphaerobolus stellatus SS14]|nr:hypothetical protein M422DRAFT_239548 [Sphaerobolus stellatus SS14]
MAISNELPTIGLLGLSTPPSSLLGIDPISDRLYNLNLRHCHYQVWFDLPNRYRMFFRTIENHVYKLPLILWSLLHSRSNTKPAFQAQDLDSHEPCIVEIGDTQQRSCFALIIGINRYANNPLKGAVADAEAFRDYLLNNLHVPKENIRLLLDHQAQRKIILEAFRALQKDTRIKRGDAIIIFYAGHGMEREAPEGWESGDPNNKIQMLVPCDFNPKARSPIHGIPDRTIGTLLEGLSEKNGNNITVIFDCCHSGSGTRVNEDDPTTVRSIEMPENVDVPSDLDKPVWSDGATHRGISFPTGFLHKGIRSHMLLAACGAKEVAREDSVLARGKFTTALLKLLREIPADRLTYATVLERMEKIPNQNPQCEGVDRNRTLFDSRPLPKPASVAFRVTKHNGQYILSAGEIHGISEGDEFTLYADSTPSKPLGVLIVRDLGSIKPFFTVLQPKSNGPLILPNESNAIKSKFGKEVALLLELPFNSRAEKLHKKLSDEMKKPQHTRIRVVEKGAGAKLGITIIDSDQVTFDILAPDVTIHGLTRLPYTVSLKDDGWYSALCAAANYHHWLDYDSPNSEIAQQVSIEFHKLGDMQAVDFEWDLSRSIRMPIGENLVRDGIIDIVPGQQDRYGFKVTNRSPRALYLNVFYFDNLDFSIVPLFHSYTGGKYTIDPPLRANGGSVPIGYGSGGERPLKFTLNPNVDIEVGFLKFFLTSESVDLSRIIQDSPFDTDSGEARKVTEDDLEIRSLLPPTWGTKLMKIVQRRYPPDFAPIPSSVTPPLQAESPAASPISSVGARSASNIYVEATDATVARRYWFGLEITKERFSSIIFAQLETVARSHSGDSTLGGGWFELAILLQSYGRGKKITTKMIKANEDGKPLTWTSHEVPLTKEPQTQYGTVFEKGTAELWKYASEGDWIGVLACAQYEKWACDGSSGKLITSVSPIRDGVLGT